MEKTRNQRRLKQFLLALVPFFLLSGIVVVIMYSIWSRNQPPVIDQGVAPSQEKPLVVHDPQFVLNSSNTLDVAVEVYNPNVVAGAEHFFYDLQFVGGSGETLFATTREGYLLPGETRYLPTLGLSFDGVSSVQSVRAVVHDVQWRDLPDFTGITLTSKGREFQSAHGNTGPIVSGAVVNSTNFDFRTVDITVVLFDAAQHVVGVNSTSIDDVRAGTERSFQVTWFLDDIVGDVGGLQVDVSTNVFDAENLLRDGSSQSSVDTLNTLDIGTSPSP